MICDLTGKQLRLVVDEIVDRWRTGDPPDACAVFVEYPQLRDHHSLAVDLAYEEFCLREESGEALNQRQFCQKFSQLRYSLARMLNLHRVLQSTSLGPASKEKTEWPQIGDRWLDWTLAEEIGRGAFSRVFLAEEPSLGNRRVVVKCSTSGAGEAFLLGKLAHGNVMPIHSIRQDESRNLVGICMPYVGRVTLADVLNRLIDPATTVISPAVFSPQLADWRTIDTEQKQDAKGAGYVAFVARLIEKVARGLAMAHQQNVLHGDIKPSNIILSFAGEPMLVDFNLSDDGSDHGQRLGGTPPYMAPERLPLLTPQGLANVDRTDVELRLRSDVFSLGVVLFELLYGDTPYEFAVEDLTATYQVKSARALESRSISGELVPRELAKIISQAIALNPQERCGSANEFADDLAHFAAQQQSRATANKIGWVGRAAIGLVLIAAATIPVIANAMLKEPSGPPQLEFNQPETKAETLPMEEPNPAAGIAGDLVAVETVSDAEPELSPERQLLTAAILNLEEQEYLSAWTNLRKLSQPNIEHEVDAWIGYCLTQLENLGQAQYHFERAQPELDGSGILWHNIGCCQSQLSKHHLAVESYSNALKCNPYCYQSYQQSALAKTRLAMRDGTALPVDALDDIESALALASDDPYLFYDAARIYAYGMTSNPELADQCRRHTRRSLELGISTTSFKGLFPKDFGFQGLVPTDLPESAPARKTAALFLPPPFDLHEIMEDLP